MSKAISRGDGIYDAVGLDIDTVTSSTHNPDLMGFADLFRLRQPQPADPELVLVEYNGNRKACPVLPPDQCPVGAPALARVTAAVGSKLLGRPVTAIFVYEPEFRIYACFDYGSWRVIWNTATTRLTSTDLAVETYSTLLHELAHAYNHEHDVGFRQALERVSGQAIVLALKKPEVFR